MITQELYRRIPKIDKLLETPELHNLIEQYGYQKTFQTARNAEEEIRRSIQNGESHIEEMITNLPLEIGNLLKKESRRHMQRVLNGTGVILHTNLGRAPLNRETAEEITRLMTGYTNLEFNLEEGTRGSRYDHFSQDISMLTGAEAAIAVNNNAAAVLVMLASLTSGREAIVSRGELVEVGGKFRIPEVMEQSGTVLVEVGTTNRTYVEDYLNKVTPDTAAFLKVHTSNYRITGFTCEAAVEELAEEGKRLGIPVLVDLGSGSLTEAQGETSVREVLAKGADLVCFSGDKLFGGPQAGIIAGRKDLVDKISRHPLMRAVRIDKFTAAAMDATARIYLEEKEPWRKIPVLNMMHRTLKELREQAETLQKSLMPLKQSRVSLEVIDTYAKTGGGSLPQEEFPSKGLSIVTDLFSPTDLAAALRKGEIPVVARVDKNSVILDMCTIFPEDLPDLTKSILEVFADGGHREKPGTKGTAKEQGGTKYV